MLRHTPTRPIAICARCEQPGVHADNDACLTALWAAVTALTKTIGALRAGEPPRRTPPPKIAAVTFSR